LTMSNTAMAAQPHQTNQITSSSDQIRDAASALPSGATTPKPNKSQGDFKTTWRADGWMPDMQTKFIGANGLRFEVLEAGSGDRLALCLHGWLCP
ncbi:MAG: hypothetical protein ACJ8AI_17920, partial [Rhodopila sp.]